MAAVVMVRRRRGVHLPCHPRGLFSSRRSCHHPRMPVNEEGPGIGVWIALGLGVLAGAFVGWPIAGLLGFFVTLVAVGLVSALLLM